jgi:predicted DNA binding protein
VAVPLTTGATTYGVLVVAPPDDQSISEGETTVLADLGRMIAQAIQRVHSQRALNAETVVTLDLRSPETDLPFGEVTSALDCALTLDHRVATADGGVIYYFGVHDADPERVCQSLRETALDGECLVVRCGDDGAPARLEVRLDERPSLPTGVLNNYGGTVTRARFADGDLFLTAELPPTVEVRTVVDALREQAPGAELVSKRTVDRPIETASVRQDQVIEKLTPKQRAALEAAYARGYYAWPRETTVEELAESFDISASTLHYRLRKAHGTVLRAVIEGRQAE